MNELKTLDGLGTSPAPWSLVGKWVVMGKDGVSLAFTSTPVVDERGAKDLDAAKASEVANANLIAAAPELYEVLREIYEDFEPMCNVECHGCKHEPGCNKWARRARVALEKAGGVE